MRKGEILNLKWKDVDFRQKLIYVFETKNGYRKEVPMNNYLTNILENIRKNESDYLFCNKNGKPFRNVRKSFDTALKKAGINDFRFHDLRPYIRF
jgi:integrase